ncbi:MAG: cell division protein CrgA, partial [Marmoricola sp.]
MSKPRARQTDIKGTSGYETSVVRCAVAVALVVIGIAWIAVYINLEMDAATYSKGLGLAKPSNPIPPMAKLKGYNFLIGFALIFLGLIVSADKRTPLGRGRGVVIGMLGCFLIGLVWVVVFYFVGADTNIPLMSSLGQKNL